MPLIQKKMLSFMVYFMKTCDPCLYACISHNLKHIHRAGSYKILNNNIDKIPVLVWHFLHTAVLYGTDISGGNSLTSRTLINMLTLLVNNGLPVKNIQGEKMITKSD